MAPNVVVTNTYKTSLESIQLAHKCSEILKTRYIPRDKTSLANMQKDIGECGFLVVSKDLELTLFYNDQEFFFHPSMSKVRIKMLRQGKRDQMLEAMAVKEGSSVLDCTLGLGSDAIVTSFAVGETGQITGLESETVLAWLVDYGLRNYVDKNRLINDAMRRVQVINENYEEFLNKQPDKSFDVVYFDPMFRTPLTKSSSMEPMRDWVNPAPLKPELINEAKRVAKARVVMKESSTSDEFQRLGFTDFTGGKYSPIRFGYIEL